MQIRYGSSSLTENGGKTEGMQRPGNGNRGGKRVTIRSTGATHPGVSLHLPEEKTQAAVGERTAGECSICQMARNFKIMPEIMPTPEPKTLRISTADILPDAEPGFCTLRLPLQQARYLGQLLLQAAEGATNSLTGTWTEEEMEKSEEKMTADSRLIQNEKEEAESAANSGEWTF